MKIHCKYDQLVDPKKLKDYEKNPNKHGDDQIARLAEIYKYQGIRHPIIVCKDRGVIAAGHGRKLAAIRAGIKEFPVVYQKFENDDMFYAFIASDNAIAAWSDLDFSMINEKIQDLGPDFDLDMLGLKDFKLDLNEDLEEEENPYTRKVESPIYEPTGDRPNLSDLFNSDKTDKLIDEIENSNLKKEIKHFLKLAAYRHTKFSYKEIAEYYAHAGKEEQLLMEKSALVIIDFDQAIELGFVNLTNEVKEAYTNE